MTKVQKLKALGACARAIRWVEKNNYLSAAQLWAKCRNPHYMRWLISSLRWHKGSAAFPLMPIDFSRGFPTPKQIREDYPWSFLKPSWNLVGK